MPFPFFFIQRERRSRSFFLYTPIVNCNFPWKSYTNIKTSTQNAPLPDKKSKNFLGRGMAPSLDPFPTRKGDTPSPGPTPIGASILALGVPVLFHLRLEHCVASKKEQ